MIGSLTPAIFGLGLAMASALAAAGAAVAPLPALAIPVGRDRGRLALGALLVTEALCSGVSLLSIRRISLISRRDLHVRSSCTSWTALR